MRNNNMREKMKKEEEEEEVFNFGFGLVCCIIALIIGIFIGGAVFMMLWNGIICSLAAVGTMSYWQGVVLYCGIRLVWPTNSPLSDFIFRGED